MSTVRPLEVGDILSYTWGYSMTLVEYFKVISVTPSSVKIQKMTANSGPEGLDGNRRKSPVDVDPAEKAMTKRIKFWDNRYGVKMDHGHAWQWSGQPLTENTYD